MNWVYAHYMAQEDEKKYPQDDKNVEKMSLTELRLVAENQDDPRQADARKRLAAMWVDPLQGIVDRLAEDISQQKWMTDLAGRVTDASLMQTSIEIINRDSAMREAIESANKVVSDLSTMPAMQKALNETNKNVADMLEKSSVWQNFLHQQEQFYRDLFGPEEEPPESLGERTDEEFLRAAGFYMIAFGQFESALIQTMLVLAGQHKAKEVFSKNWWRTGDYLCKHLEGAIKRHDPEGDVAKDAQTLLDFYETARKLRNHLMHGEMVMLPTKEKYQDRLLKSLDFPTWSVKPKKDKKYINFEVKPVSAAVFNEQSRNLEIMYQLAQDLMTRLDPDDERFEMWG